MATSDLCTVAQVKVDLEMSDARYDALIGSLVTSASRAIMQRTRREFAPQSASTARDFHAAGRVVDMAPGEARSVTSVVLDPDTIATTLSSAQYRLRLAPQSTTTYATLVIGASVSLPAALDEFGSYVVRVTATWGAWDTASVPEDVRRACVVTVGAWMDRAIAEYGVDTGDGRSVGLASAGTWAIPGAAWTLLQPYARMVV